MRELHQIALPHARRPCPYGYSFAESCLADDLHMSPRELYFKLVNIDQFPTAYAPARQYAEYWFGKISKAIERGKSPELLAPFAYHPRALDDWYERKHRTQVDAYTPPTESPLVTRDQVIWLAKQFAPMSLTDGSWVQRAARAGSSQGAISALLFHTYWDEVGNGIEKLNHGNVYRDLLAEMGVRLPEFDTREFCEHKDLLEASFVLPAFTMSLSLSPKRCLPELLGFNLASEINGLGKEYMGIVDVLRHYKFDPYFFELHNIIDNASTGHSAWARDAVRMHMDDVRVLGGEPLVQEHWRRVWVGVRSLDVVIMTWVKSVGLTIGPALARQLVARKIRAAVSRFRD